MTPNGPCGCRETQGAFAERASRELAPRLGRQGGAKLAVQTDFPEPLARVNADLIDRGAYGGSESAAWDAMAEYYEPKAAVRG